MSFYDDASWLLIPSGIEEDIVFAQKPISGLGDLSFTRASDATYTDSTGVVRRSPYNLVTQSVWTGGGVNVAPTGWSQADTTGNFEPQTAINGSVPYRFYATNGRRSLRQVLNFNTGQEIRLSVFVNSVTITSSISGVIGLSVLTTANVKYYVNNVEVDGSTNITANTRIAISLTFTSSGAATIRIGGGSFGASTYDYVISQPQLVEGTSALDYFPTTNRQDVPRIDFRNADGTLSSCGRLLLEPQRTNSIRNSSMVGAVAGSPGTLPTNWVFNNDAGLTRTIIGVGVENGLPYFDVRYNGTATSTFSIELRAEQPTQIAALTGQAWSHSVYMRYISSAAAPSAVQIGMYERTSGGSAISSGASTTSLTSSLQRFTLNRTLSGGATVAFVQPYVAFLVNNATAYDFTIRIAAPQMELGGYATTWVPTTTAAVTRLADTASKTGVSSLIGQTEGTLFVDCSAVPIDTKRLSISDGTTANNIFMQVDGTNRIRFIITQSGVSILDTGNITIPNPNGFNKIAFAYKSNSFAVYVNGTQFYTSSAVSFSFPVALSRIAFDLAPSGLFFYGNINQAALFPTRLTNAQLAQLTTL